MERSLSTLARNRKPVKEVVGALVADDITDSLRAGKNLTREAKSHGLNIRDYLTLAVKVDGEAKELNMNGYEAALHELGLPIKDDFQHGIVLEAAAETFQTFPGTRALFPEVIDDVLKFKYRQVTLENVDGMLAQTRVINGAVLLSTIVTDSQDDYSNFGFIGEGSRVPLRSIRTSQYTVPIHKYGGGFEFTYEFERRAHLPILVPYAARVAKEASIGFAGVAAQMLFNGDSVAAAATVVTSTMILNGTGTAVGGPIANGGANPIVITAGQMNWEIYLKWLIGQAQKGVPVDTVVGNYDMLYEFDRMFAKPYLYGQTQAEVLQKAGVQTAVENPRFNFNVQFCVSSAAPAGQMVGFVKAETLEELEENGSDIEESIRSIDNQKIRVQRTINKGYRIIFADTRSVLQLV